MSRPTVPPRRPQAGDGAFKAVTSRNGEAHVHELPEVDTADGLTVRQRKVLDVIRDAVAARGYPPSVREIGEAVGLTSPSSVAHQLRTLEQKGFLRRDPNRPRRDRGRPPGRGSTPTGFATHSPRRSTSL